MSDPADDGDEVLDPEEAERRITEFIEGTASLAGPPVEELGDTVAALMAVAWADLEALLGGLPHDKVLATMLLVGQRARQGAADDPATWQLHAASSLLSGFVARRSG